MSIIEYSDLLLDHFYYPRNVGELDLTNSQVRQLKTGEYHRGDVMVLYLLLAENKIISAKFKAYGSPAAIGVCSWLTEKIINKTLEQIQQITSQQIIDALKLPETRHSCALMAEDLLHG